MTAARCGFDGKLPNRGDFVARGLPRSFTRPWQAWVEAGLTASRSALGDGWLAAWLEAPIWHFALPADACGPDAVLGLFLPSVDRVGRYYPLTFAALCPGQPGAPDAGADAVWLERMAALGRQAVSDDTAPDALAAAMALVPAPCCAGDGAEAVWWTEGSPRVPARRMSLGGLPAPQDFAGMIDAGWVR